MHLVQYSFTSLYFIQRYFWLELYLIFTLAAFIKDGGSMVKPKSIRSIIRAAAVNQWIFNAQRSKSFNSLNWWIHTTIKSAMVVSLTIRIIIKAKMPKFSFQPNHQITRLLNPKSLMINTNKRRKRRIHQAKMNRKWRQRLEKWR